MTYSLLHISDCHFGKHFVHTKYASRSMPIAWKLLLDFVENNVDRLNGIFVSGDIVDRGTSKQVSLAMYLLFGVQVGNILIPEELRGEPSLSSFGLPIYWIPGNHDRFHFGHMRAPGGKLIDSVQAGRGSIRIDLTPQILNVGSKRVLFAGLDLSVRKMTHALPPILGMFGQGRYYTDAIPGAEKKLPEADAVLWGMHFAPYTNIRWFALGFSQTARTIGGLIQLIGAKELLSFSKRNGVVAILCGHTHVSDQGTVQGMKLSVAGSCMVGDVFGQSFSLYRFRDRGTDLVCEHTVFRLGRECVFEPETEALWTL